MEGTFSAKHFRCNEVNVWMRLSPGVREIARVHVIVASTSSGVETDVCADSKAVAANNPSGSPRTLATQDM